MAWTEERRPDFGIIKYQIDRITSDAAFAVLDVIEETDELWWQLRDRVYYMMPEVSVGEDVVCGYSD